MMTDKHKAPSVAHNTGTSGDNATSVARYDLSTGEGGRRYVADFFARELRRHDFARYITTTLAADFSCALAQHLAATGEQQVGEVQGDVLHISGEDRAVLQRIQDALPTVGLNGWTKGVEVLERLLRDSLAARQPGWNAEQLDRALGETIDQRDRYHEVADDLAAHIERITGVEIGEHSSVNCPWQNAIDAAESYTPAQGIDLGQQQDAARWRAIAPLLSVEWDEDDQLKRWTWIDFKGDAPAIPSPTRQEYASVDEAVDALIHQRDAALGVGNG